MLRGPKSSLFLSTLFLSPFCSLGYLQSFTCSPCSESCKPPFLSQFSSAVSPGTAEPSQEVFHSHSTSQSRTTLQAGWCSTNLKQCRVLGVRHAV